MLIGRIRGCVVTHTNAEIQGAAVLPRGVGLVRPHPRTRDGRCQERMTCQAPIFFFVCAVICGDCLNFGYANMHEAHNVHDLGILRVT